MSWRGVLTSTFDVPPKIVCFSLGAISRHHTSSACRATDLFIYLFSSCALRRQLRRTQENILSDLYLQLCNCEMMSTKYCCLCCTSSVEFTVSQFERFALGSSGHSMTICQLHSFLFTFMYWIVMRLLYHPEGGIQKLNKLLYVQLVHDHGETRSMNTPV